MTLRVMNCQRLKSNPSVFSVKSGNSVAVHSVARHLEANMGYPRSPTRQAGALPQKPFASCVSVGKPSLKQGDTGCVATEASTLGGAEDRDGV